MGKAAPVEKRSILWMILLRLLIVSLLLVLAVVIEYSASFVFPVISLLYLILATYLLSGVYFLLYLWGERLKTQALLQILGDLLLVTIFVHLSGGVTSSAYFLYVLPILGAGFVLSRRAAYLTAALAAIFFGVLVDAMYLGLFTPVDPEAAVDLSLGSILYDIFIAWSAFFLIAFLVSELAARLRRAREALRIARRDLAIGERLADAGRISATMAHEIRNPLAAISGSVQVLRREIPLDTEQRGLMDVVVKESQRVSHILDQFLDFAQPQRQAFAVVSLPDLLDETLTILRGSGELNGRVEVRGNFASSGLHYFGSAAQFKQVFWNILKNSLKAMPGGGAIDIDFEAEDKRGIRMRFADTGIGMSPEEVGRLFEPFQSGFEGGRGLGLALVRRIVDDYEGRIEVRSEKYKGTEITISLPARERAEP
jgi:two-component system sensor histidine kinase PilS (NtrC family)